MPNMISFMEKLLGSRSLPTFEYPSGDASALPPKRAIDSQRANQGEGWTMLPIRPKSDPLTFLIRLTSG